MKLFEYQQLAARTMRPSATPAEHEKNLAILGLGLAGEAGEVVELLKKHLGHGHELDIEKAEKELGDVTWYLAALCTELGLSFEHVAELNIEKLRKRYPAGFSEAASRGRAE